MHLDIRPFTGDTSANTDSSDSRTTSFMESLRARVAAEDAKQQQKWDKLIRPVAVKRKPMTPGNPHWLEGRKPAAPAAAPKAAKPAHPFGSAKRKRAFETTKTEKNI